LETTSEKRADPDRAFIPGTALRWPDGFAADSSKRNGRVDLWQSYRAIQIAAAEFARHDLDVSRYRITVIDNAATSIIVIFVDVDAPDNPGIRGNPGKIPGFEVELARDNLHVVRSHFIR
jgi:hypothetical protein